MCVFLVLCTHGYLFQLHHYFVIMKVSRYAALPYYPLDQFTGFFFPNELFFVSLLVLPPGSWLLVLAEIHRPALKILLNFFTFLQFVYTQANNSQPIPSPCPVNHSTPYSTPGYRSRCVYGDEGAIQLGIALNSSRFTILPVSAIKIRGHESSAMREFCTQNRFQICS